MQTKKQFNKFLIRLGLLSIGFYLIYGTVAFYKWIILPSTHAYAYISGGILNLLGFENQVNGSSILSDLVSLNISIGCDGIEGMVLFSLAILAMPIVYKHKAKGLLLGLTTLVILNLVRIISLYFTSLYIPNLFDFMHLQLWQILYLIIAGIIWYIWASSYLSDLSEFSTNA